MNSLLNTLLTQPQKFDFFQAVRLLEQAYLEENKPINAYHLNQQSNIKFTTHLSLHFNPSAIERISLSNKHEKQISLTVNFMSLMEAHGVLPAHYTELLLQRNREKNNSLTKFLDIFQNRLLSLFYQSWKKHRWFINFEQARLQGKLDNTSQLLLSLAGNPNTNLDLVLANMGHFSRQTHNVNALSNILQDYFGVDVDILQFQADMLVLDSDTCTRLTKETTNNCLGVDMVVGNKVWQYQNKFRIRLGPLANEQFKQFLPHNGTALTKLTQIVRSFVGVTLNFDVQLIVAKNNVPRWRLNQSIKQQLGWNTWLYKNQFTEDVSDVILKGRIAG